jgi:CheY-like chemotaxis protein
MRHVSLVVVSAKIGRWSLDLIAKPRRLLVRGRSILVNRSCVPSKLTKRHLILLDINIPPMNGLKFPEVIRADRDLESALVFMITTSKTEEDKTRAYGQNVAGYIVKRDPVNRFMQAVSLLKHY